MRIEIVAQNQATVYRWSGNILSSIKINRTKFNCWNVERRLVSCILEVSWVLLSCFLSFRLRMQRYLPTKNNRFDEKVTTFMQMSGQCSDCNLLHITFTWSLSFMFILSHLMQSPAWITTHLFKMFVLFDDGDIDFTNK